MKNLKTYIVVLLTCLIGLSFCKTKNAKKDLPPALELSAQLGGIVYLDTTRTIHISTTLFNPTSDTLSFVSMTCSYEDMFLTDTSAFKVQSRYDCYSNSPTVISIPPNARLDQFIMIRPVNKDVEIIDSKLKIGMFYLVPKREDGFEGIIRQYQNREKAKILWSNELDLKRLFRRMYQ